jgi:L-iditol 2-dehydrogenase
MKQAVMTEPKRIEFREVPAPAPREGEVLVKIMRIGVCGSDIHVFHGQHPFTRYPVVQGHEVSGTVEKLGKGAGRFKPGDKVTIEPQVSCGACYPCTHGLPNICNDLKVLGFQTTGTASDYFVVPESKLVRLPDDLSMSEGAMIEPTAVGVRAVEKGGGARGRKVLVLGAGPIGNLTAQVARGSGARSVMIADLNDFRLSIALACGIDFAVNPGSADLASEVKRAFGPDGPDLIIECVGSDATMTGAVEIARKGTDIVVVGVFGRKASVDMGQVQEKELRLIGLARYVIGDFAKAIALVQEGKVRLSPLVTHEFDFYDYAEAYGQIDRDPGRTMKVIIRVNEQ